MIDTEPPKSLGQRVTEIEHDYYELILAVARKFPGESRHETALRYIKEMEEYNHTVDQVAKQA